jgi:DNA-binding MarR family transcriptional regulator
MQDRSQESPYREVMEAQKAISRELFRTTMPEWIHLDLTMGQLKTLMALASQPTLNVSTLAETLNISKPTASILVDQLVQRGYVARTEDAEDRRRTLLTLSQQGSDLVAELRQSDPKGRMMQWLEMMDPDDLAALTRGLQAMVAVIQRETAPPLSATT